MPEDYEILLQHDLIVSTCAKHLSIEYIFLKSFI